MHTKLKAAVLGVSALVTMAAAQAYTHSDTIAVSANIVGSCEVSAGDLDFGTTPSNTPTLAYANITITCDDGTPYNVAINAGQNHLSGLIARRARSAGTDNYMNYFLRKPNNSDLWGDSDFGNTFSGGSSLAGTGNGSPQVLQAIGSNTSGAPIGTYSDTLVVTVHY